MKAAVLGSGAGARAAAGELSLNGWQVRMWDLPAFAHGLNSLRDDPRIELSGRTQGIAQLHGVPREIGDACAGAEVIVVVSQALGHTPMAEALAPIIEPEQTIVVMPGSTGGALAFRRAVAGARGLAPTIAETATLPHAARIVGDRGVRIVHHVGLVKLAALPAAETGRVLDMLKPVFGGLDPAANVLETMLCNGNPVIHPAVMLLNAGLVERAQGDWEFYEDGVTPSVAELIRAADEERLALGRAMGLELLPEPEMSRRQGYSETNDYLGAYRDGPGFQKLGGPAVLGHRYLTEDVACGMVTMLELGDVFGVAMPTMQAITQIASVVLGRDLRGESARGLAALGLGGMSAHEIVQSCEVTE